MMWVVVGANSDIGTIYGRIDDDGLMRVTCTDEYPEFFYWLAEGNQPEIIDLTQ